MPGASQTEIAIRSGRGHVVGVVRSGVLEVGASSSRHMLRQPERAWCIELVVLAAAERATATRVRIRDRDTSASYTASLADFRALGFRVDRGWGAQLGLALKHWNATPEKQLSLFGRDG